MWTKEKTIAPNTSEKLKKKQDFVPSDSIFFNKKNQKVFLEVSPDLQGTKNNF